jgi:hypothetical protein
MNVTYGAAEQLQQLGELEQRRDPAADRVIEGLTPKRRHELRTYAERKAFLPELMFEIAKDISLVEPAVRNFLDAGEALNPIIESNLPAIEQAQRFFDDNGVAVITTLFHASLPEAYLGRRGVQALDMTGELFSNWTRRVQETGQFLVNVLTPPPQLGPDRPSSLSSARFGARAVRRVRLTHAAIRWMLDGTQSHELTPIMLRNVQGSLTAWRSRLHEQGIGDGSAPLNQEDLLATLGTFTTVMFRGLERLAVPFTEADREAFYFLWSVVGWHLGIGDVDALGAGDARPGTPFPGNRLLPLDVETMDATYDHLAKKLQKSSDQGRRMGKALIQELSAPLPRPVQGAPAFVARYLIGDRLADDLAIEEGGYTEILLTKSGILDRFVRRARSGSLGRMAMSGLAQLVTRYAVRAFVTQARWSERGLTIDPGVAARWGIQLPPHPPPPPRLAVRR